MAMYYTKQKVDHDLENGISDPADTIEELFVFINQMVERSRATCTDAFFEDMIHEWEGETNEQRDAT